jgi:hypothetical protein
MLTKDSVAVLVDCWETEYIETDVDRVYSNIIKTLNRTKEIKAVILASYDVDDIPTDNLWYMNHTKLRNHSQKTADVILNYVNPDKLQIAMTSFEDFAGFLDKHREIENIYFMGQSWNSCIMNRPIGIKSCGNIQRNIIINQKCVWNADTHSLLNMERDCPEESYIKLKDHVYQYIW